MLRTERSLCRHQLRLELFPLQEPGPSQLKSAEHGKARTLTTSGRSFLQLPLFLLLILAVIERGSICRTARTTTSALLLTSAVRKTLRFRATAAPPETGERLLSTLRRTQ